jgi:hypothetical protein
VGLISIGFCVEVCLTSASHVQQGSQIGLGESQIGFGESHIGFGESHIGFWRV